MAPKPKIKSFRFVQNYYATSGFYTPQVNQDYSLNSKALRFLFAFVGFFVASLAYFVFKANSIGEHAFSYCLSMSLLWGTVLIATITQKIPNTLQLIEKYDEFIHERSLKTESSKMTPKYVELIEKIEQIWDLLYFAWTKISVFVIFSPAVLLTAINYFINDLGDESFYLTIPVMLPFNWKNPVSYLIIMSLEYLLLLFGSEIVCVSLCFFIGSCFLLKLFVEDVKNELHSMEDEDTSNGANSMVKNKKIIFCTVVKDHSDMKQFVDEVNEIYEFAFTNSFIWNLLVLCCTILIMQLKLSGYAFNAMELSVTFVDMFWTFILILIFCELGEMVTTQFDTFGEALERCNWYSFPIEMQQLMIVVMANAQHPTLIRGYGNILCTRDTFKKMIKASFSYFMMLRKISQ